MKILAINIAFHSEMFYKRWRLLAQLPDVQVTLVGPSYYEYHEAGDTLSFQPEEIQEGDFKVRHVQMTPKRYLRNDWWDWKLVSLIKKESPDIIYLIGYESRNALFMSKLAMMGMKNKPLLGLFSMRGKDIPTWNKEFMWRWKLGRKWYDFIHVHYPEGKRIYEEQIGYAGPVNIHTQIGFDQDVYFPNQSKRAEIRAAYNIHPNDFVFSAAMRIEDSKGLYEIIEACRINKDLPYKFLLMGNGKEMVRAQKKIKELGLSAKIILPGMVKTGPNVADHLNASDCFVHVPKNVPYWVDTFPLAVVQAMGCGLPVIGSNSGAVPYQLGANYPFIIPEGAAQALATLMKDIVNGVYDLQEIGQMSMNRAVHCFEIRHLNKCLIHNFRKYLAQDNTDLIKDITDENLS